MYFIFTLLTFDILDKQHKNNLELLNKHRCTKTIRRT